MLQYICVVSNTVDVLYLSPNIKETRAKNRQDVGKRFSLVISLNVQLDEQTTVVTLLRTKLFDASLNVLRRCLGCLYSIVAHAQHSLFRI